MSAPDTALLRTPRAGLARPLAWAGALLRRVDLPLVAIVAIAFVWVEHYAGRVTHWGVMTDELQYVRLAMSVWQDHTIVPHIHGEYVHIYSQLYPLVLAPVYGAFGTTTAFHVAHILNALIMASTAIPAYLLARELTGHRVGSYAVAAVSVAVPWMVLSTLLLTEVLAYPVFVWAAWAVFRALIRPSTRRDVVAVIWLVLAFFTRTQFVVLWAIVPLALLIHELGYRGAGGPAGSARVRLERVWREHRVLVVVYAFALLGLVLAHFRGGVNQVLGSYAITTSGDLWPNGMPEFIRTHAMWVAAGIGVVPALLAAAWGVTSLLRPLDRRAHAFASLLVVTTAVMTVQVASFTLRFTQGPAFEDRYLFYVVPLVLAGALACLVERRARTIALLVTGVAMAYLLGITKFQPLALPFFASPDVVFHQVLSGRAWDVGHRLGIDNLSAAAALRWGTVLLAVALAAALRYAPRRGVMAVVGVVVLAWCAAETTYTFRKLLPPAPAGDLSLNAKVFNEDWVDRLLPGDARASIVPSAMYDNDAGTRIWWDLELWNKKVTRAIGVSGGGPLFTPFPASAMARQLSTGRLVGDEPTPYLIFDAYDARFRPEAVAPVRLVRWYRDVSELVVPRRPWRADWGSVGFDVDGWGLAGNHTRSVRVYGYGSPKGRMVGLTLSTQGLAGGPARFAATAQGRRYAGALSAKGSVSVQVPVCVRPPRRFVDVAIATPGSLRLPDGRRVTVHLDRVNAIPDPGACARAAGR